MPTRKSSAQPAAPSGPATDLKSGQEKEGVKRMPLIVNTDEVPKPAPVGQYPVTWTSHEVKDAASSNYPNLVVQFVGTAAAPNEMAGKKFQPVYFSSNPNAFNIFKSAAIAAGADPDEFKKDQVDMLAIADKLIGNDVILVMEKDKQSADPDATRPGRVLHLTN